MKAKTVFFILIYLFSFRLIVVSQSVDLIEQMQLQVKQYNEKINELIRKNESNGFHILLEKKLPMKSQLETVLITPLYKGDWYHFCFIGDPSSDKIKATLFLEGYGDIIQDRIIVRREHEFWTEFSFMCPHSGPYEFTFFQKSAMNRPLSYFVIFKKETMIRGTE